MILYQFSKSINVDFVLHFSAPRQCIICGKLASFECLSCFGDHGSGLDSTAFCDGCHERVHAHAKRRDHKPNPLNVPPVSPCFSIIVHFELNRVTKV